MRESKISRISCFILKATFNNLCLFNYGDAVCADEVFLDS
jgi:hypothetical protein